MFFCPKRRWPQCRQARAHLQCRGLIPQTPLRLPPPLHLRHPQLTKIRSRPHRGSSITSSKRQYHANSHSASCSLLIQVSQMKATTRHHVTFQRQIADLCLQDKNSQRSKASMVTGNMRHRAGSSMNSFLLSIRSPPQLMTRR